MITTKDIKQIVLTPYDTTGFTSHANDTYFIVVTEEYELVMDNLDTRDLNPRTLNENLKQVNENDNKFY